MRNPSKKTIKHMARKALFQIDTYNPIVRDIRRWENMNPELVRRERWKFYYVYQKIFMEEKKKLRSMLVKRLCGRKYVLKTNTHHFLTNKGE